MFNYIFVQILININFVKDTSTCLLIKERHLSQRTKAKI